MDNDEKYEALETLVANLLIMQKVTSTMVDAIQDVLHAKGFLTADDLEAINSDIQDALREQPVSSVE